MNRLHGARIKFVAFFLCAFIFCIGSLYCQERLMTETQFYSLETELTDPAILSMLDKVHGAIDGKVMGMVGKKNDVKEVSSPEEMQYYPQRLPMKFKRLGNIKEVKPSDLVLVITLYSPDEKGIYSALVRHCHYEYGKRRYASKSTQEFVDSKTKIPDNIQTMEAKILKWLKIYAFK